MAKIKALLLSQGMHGMISQLEGLAKSMNLDFRHHKVELKPFWNLVPPRFTPVNEFILKERFVCESKIVISCGRKSVIPSIILKNKFKNDIFTIHIQDPKVNFKHFDLVIAPEHDELVGENVISTIGAIHYLTKEEIESEKNYIQIEKEDKKIVAVILGGPNKYYNFSEKNLENIFHKIKKNFTSDKYKIIFIPSYRTPEEVIQKVYHVFSHSHKVFRKIDKRAYLSALGLADTIVVTCDSTSMISEAAMTGKPVYIAQMPAMRPSKRFNKFFKKFKELNFIKDLEDNIEEWSYNPLNEVKRILPLINKKLTENGII